MTLLNAIRMVNSQKPLVALENEQIDIITKYFQELFSSEEDTLIPVAPVMITPPFTSDEIQRATSKLKNKATGIDEEWARRTVHTNS